VEEDRIMYESAAVPQRPTVNAGRLWSGGLATALIAALISLVGILLTRGLFDVPVLAPKGEGVWGGANTFWYSFGAACAALVATGLMHVLLLTTPRPMMFFTWAVGLATVAAVLTPFMVEASLASRMCTSILNLVIGAAIGSLVAGTARAALRPPASQVRPVPRAYP
jgi:hypothetical protein